ncbi:anaerobic selenocysteine-containing dehydrogenase [Bacillus mesophilus]|uniref:Molybdopterin-dependent oxidoreductase n=1 Tax=Bacillus mesophilus TaxID=1808955 RepID=A0A6M0Q9V0_9BACI|nr:molybdopterin-dependent oxidoreductase [Bacillus mesophilus]MBM7662226.1 anaerobic selenocysteine-containing dehydrogenase [Bacillus mesophilus]NEY73134.1 molybdopterin-dependent oxidoreductase [Bacillus mesophilus]
MGRIVKSACPLNCWDSCGFNVTIENGQVAKVEGDPEHPITKGKICGRGRMLETRTNSKQRVTTPLKKIDGEFLPISWNQAIEEIAQQMSSIKDEYGTTAVLHSHDYANSGLLINLDKRFFNCYGGVTEVIGSLCWGAGIEAQKWDFGDSYSHSPEDILNSKHIVIWGRNVARTNMHLYEYIQKAKSNGATVIVIDPIYNATAKIANHYISIKPGMDSFLALGIMKEVLRLNLEDRSFINHYSIGFSDVKELLESVTLSELSSYSEIPEEVFTMLAEIYGNGPTMTYLGLGMQRYENGGNTIRTIDALIAMSGNVGIPGGGANYGNLQVGQSFNYEALTLPKKRKHSRQFTMMKQAEEVLSASEPPIKMIVVTCGNPLTQVPDTNKVRKAFESVDTVVVLEQYLTDTASLADYVLPVATSFEVEDLYYASMYHGYVNYGGALVEAPGEAKPDLWIWSRLADKLGFGEEFNFTREQFLEMGISNLRDKGISLEKLKQEHHLRLPIKDVPWEDKKFKTPSGKYEFTSTRYTEELGKLLLSFPRESARNNPGLSKKYPYSLLSLHPLRSNHSQNYHLIAGIQEIKVEVSEDIAEEIGLKDQDKVKVFNDRGNVEGTVKIMKKAHPKTINIDEGNWSKFGGTVNLLTSDEPSDNGLGSILYDCLVNIEKV